MKSNGRWENVMYEEIDIWLVCIRVHLGERAILSYLMTFCRLSIIELCTTSKCSNATASLTLVKP